MMDCTLKKAIEWLSQNIVTAITNKRMRFIVKVTLEITMIQCQNYRNINLYYNDATSVE